ncbi:pyridoxamine 5'-phosphate oxidase [Exilibacterium tricleocarpae]|uniref:Pyridoxine/pyridoxamine 5'-phosphate oxidase n=1 Tax=Exilibacterium tricleocarpae TaxID=2591008 RepID=A0A545TQK3_9GAMM|nr:pyridoxamine 5'-phosphate oxidase [Exilibacterium tricleocarpae]TQV79500.1 pyridoxamine 5'-phosphate oxidase [Exilibacterium tricleocarpae]
MDIDQIRREYLQGGLRREDLRDDPMAHFDLWLEQAIASGVPDPTAMTLATVDSAGRPSQRIVLLKHVDSRGFVFFTNYESRKASDIAANPQVSLHFPWHGMERQVKVCGRAAKVPAAETLKYFITRPKDSQLAAWASAQSRPVSSRQLLLQQFQAMKKKFGAGEVPVPDFWGGFRVVPEQMEFWQGGASRLHDRFEYRLQEAGSWQIERLAP